MKINIPMVVTAADVVKRTLTGTIVTWNEQGNTSVGPTVFAKDSIEMKNVKLLLEHDRTRPIGKLADYEITDSGITARFVLAKTFSADDALEEAATGLRDGFSVGAQINEWTNVKGVMQITSATLDEVSLVTDPAIDSARVSEVAASENEEKKDSDLATADSEKPTEGDQVSDTTAPAPAVEEAVEAAKANMVEAARPAFYTAPRLEFTKAKYLENSVRAKLGDDDARQYVMAADDTTSNNAGLIPTRQLTEVINPLSNADRSTIDAISRGVLPDAGMSFEIPKITAVPTVEDENEGDAIVETGMTNSFLTVNVNKYAGGQTFSVELLDRSNPVFFDELVRQMEYAYALATDKFVATTIVSSGQLAPTTQANTATGLLGFVAEAAAEVYADSLGFARNLIVTPEQWSKIMSYNDSGRPIYTASQPQNAGGAVSPQSLRGNVAGLDLYVSRALGINLSAAPVGDGSMIVINPDSYTWYESSRFRLQTNVALNGQIEVAYYGYGALATKVANGSCHFNLT
jgi:HK97 family phage prohead protease